MRVNSTELQNAFGKYLAMTEQEDIIITKNNTSVAILSKYRDSIPYIIRDGQAEYDTPEKATYEQFEALTERSDKRFELINGIIYELASPGLDHQIIVNRIFGKLLNHFQNGPCIPLTAPLDVQLYATGSSFTDDPNIVQPDILIICDSERIDGNGKYIGRPTLVVEILSPSTRGKDLIVKLDLYRRSGIREYWIADPVQQCILLYSFDETGKLDVFKSYRQDETVVSVIFDNLKLQPFMVFVKS
jgi:prevent-host-death family protein